jgi:hypothetical protein
MAQIKSTQDDPSTRRKIAIGVWAIFIAEFVSLLFANARIIAQPGMIAQFNGMALFAWLIALPGLAGAAATLLFGKLSDVYGRRAIILLAIAIFSLGLAISAMSTSMVFLVTAQTFMTIGHFPMAEDVTHKMEGHMTFYLESRYQDARSEEGNQKMESRTTFHLERKFKLSQQM